ncbi:protein kinase domain-containing protein [Dactylosporangium sp. CA-233914]|uniref:serine/threonine-protein kinase n=1 Tax=Dactylosporangium sp. CA-233914 TaxID=3239934 RepID=UPI003D9274F1
MSVVWRAFDEVLERPVAVKLLAPKLLADPVSRRRIQAEARAAALLSHPHIAQVYDFGHGPDGVPYVVMELVTGPCLEDAGRLSTAEILRAGGELAAALAAVHARGLVHRDVKPANVMLTDGGAKLVDFGISAVAGEHSDRHDEILGTPAYVAPERIRGLPTTAATDVYALGLLLYRTLTGHFPWPAGSDNTGVLEFHRRGRPEPLPAGLLPSPVAAAVTSCLAKAPENRPSAGEMARLLSSAASRTARFSSAPLASRVLATAPVRAADPRPAQSGSLPLPRIPAGPRGRVAVAGVVAAAVVGGLAMCSPGSASTGADKQPTWMAAASPTPTNVDCAVEYSVRGESEGHFQADLHVRAEGAPGGWSLRFRLPEGQAIGTVDGATWRQDGPTVLLGGADVLELAGGADFGVTGAYGESAALPTDFALNDTACRSVLLAPAAQPAPAVTTTVAPPSPTKAPAVKGPAKNSKKEHEKKENEHD